MLTACIYPEVKLQVVVITFFEGECKRPAVNPTLLFFFDLVLKTFDPSSRLIAWYLMTIF